MLEHRTFKYDSLENLKKDAADAGIELPFATGVKTLLSSLTIAGKTVPNRIVAQPMEGCDSEPDGSPSDLTVRRYRRFARGGAGMLWFEANAVVPEGKANPRHMMLTAENLPAFKGMVDSALGEAREGLGSGHRPYTILQLTHAGRHSRPLNTPQQVIAASIPWMESRLVSGWRTISDEELEALEDRFVTSAELARDAGFDAVDIKSCHGYLISELLAAHTRSGRYGGSFENRIRFLCNVFDKIRVRLGESITLGMRINGYDALAYPYSWGVNRDDPTVEDLSEPIKLFSILREKGLAFVNISAGTPYYNPHINRPYDSGPYRPTEPQLKGVHRLLSLARQIQTALPDLPVVSTGLSWLREFGPLCASQAIEDKWFTLAGFGRMILAYPDFPADLMQSRPLERKKCCIACGKCSEIMRFDGRTGCVVHDAEVYRPIYKALSEGKPSLVSRREAEHL